MLQMKLKDITRPAVDGRKFFIHMPDGNKLECSVAKKCSNQVQLHHTEHFIIVLLQYQDSLYYNTFAGAV